jgi:hypothetical protein
MMRILAFVMVVGAALPTAAQVQTRPTDPPIVTAEVESWYRLREPIQFAGTVYYPAGVAVFFNGQTMLRTGHYNGVPLYADTTIEPYSIVYVPIGRGLLQPYERPREGELAGTTGSRTPAFPVRNRPDTLGPLAAVSAPTSPPLPIGAISTATLESVDAGNSGGTDVGQTLPITTAAAYENARALVSARPPESNDGIWVRFKGEKWVSAGPALPFIASAFVQVGEYAGFPVFARQGLQEEVIYLPTAEGLVAPYKSKG